MESTRNILLIFMIISFRIHQTHGYLFLTSLFHGYSEKTVAAPFSDDTLPHLPEKFYMNWTIYNVPAEYPWPPYPDDVIAAPYCAGRANSYYDWSKRALIEVYHDFCVPIFQNGSNWRCHFLNVNDTAYLISLDKTSPYPPCCVFGQPWQPPSPDFVKSVPYNRTTRYKGKLVDWYMLNGPYPDPFAYGWYRQRLPVSGQPTPGFFWFRATSGWASQTFYNITEGAPPADIFDVPPECAHAKNCGYLEGLRR